MIIYLCLFVIDFFIIKCKKVPSSADAEEKNDDFIQVCRAMQGDFVVILLRVKSNIFLQCQQFTARCLVQENLQI